LVKIDLNFDVLLPLHRMFKLWSVLNDVTSRSVVYWWNMFWHFGRWQLLLFKSCEWNGSFIRTSLWHEVHCTLV